WCRTRASRRLRRCPSVYRWWSAPLLWTPWCQGRLLRDLGDLERLGLLGAVRVLRAGVDLELAQLGPTERGLGQHAAHGLLDDALRVSREQLGIALGLEATRITGVAVGDLVLTLAPGERDLVGVDDDDEVTSIDVRREGGLVLAPQQRGGLARETTEDDVGSVDDVPVALSLAGLGGVRTHEW